MTTFEEDLAFVDSLTQKDKLALLESLKDTQPALVPLPGPQTMAFETEADVTLYGGAAGGGKTFLAVILALTKHKRTLMIRKEASQLYAVQDEIEGIIGSRDGFNSQNGIWRLPNNEITDPYNEKPSRQIRFGGLSKPGDAAKYQGAPRDLLIIDEAANISYGEYEYLTVWERSIGDPSQRTRTLLCSNPPTDATGMWMVSYFAPWLDDDYPNPAEDGEIRWFIVVDDESIEVEGEGEYEIDGKVYSAESRTFIGAKVDDNPHAIRSGYKRKLQRLSSHLRERMLDGKFLSSLEDAPMQVIPTAWVEAAQDRWKSREADAKKAPPDANRMTAVGVDPARGGQDEMTICTRHGYWYSKIQKIPGKDVPDGKTGAARVLLYRRDDAQVNIDTIGIGSSVYDVLQDNGIDCLPLVGNSESVGRSKDGLFTFKNLRAEMWWRLRESLDPVSGDDIMLPPDRKMKEDLCAFTYKELDGAVIQVESKEQIRTRLKRSPDAGDAVLYASYGAPMKSDLRRGSKRYKVKRCI